MSTIEISKEKMHFFSKKMQKYLVDKNKGCIFAAEFELWKGQLQRRDGRNFCLRTLQEQHNCCSPSGNRPKAFVDLSTKVGFTTVFLFNSFFIRQMERSVKNAPEANNSSKGATPEGVPTVSAKSSNAKSSAKSRAARTCDLPEATATTRLRTYTPQDGRDAIHYINVSHPPAPIVSIKGAETNDFLRALVSIWNWYLFEESLIPAPNYALTNMRDKINALYAVYHGEREKLRECLTGKNIEP